MEDDALEYPFSYGPDMLKDLMPFLHVSPVMEASPLAQYVRGIDRTRRKTIDFLVDLNTRMQRDIAYLIRLEPGVQSCDETLEKRSGSCRNSAWLMVNVLRRLGLAARFVSGYLIQLTADLKSRDGPSGPEEDFTDLHAWVEVFLPSAGWIGLDPTSGLLAGEGHIPLARTPDPVTAASITGTASHAASNFQFHMSVTRIHEDPRITKPYTEEPWTSEDTASNLQIPVVIEGYEPPHDPRINHLKVTPDPGVIEINVHPAHDWDELVDITSSVYEDARRSRLGTEKFDLDGSHTGTGGGNHVVLGGPTAPR